MVILASKICCPTCNVPFERRYTVQKYCSKPCQIEFNAAQLRLTTSRVGELAFTCTRCRTDVLYVRQGARAPTPPICGACCRQQRQAEKYNASISDHNCRVCNALLPLPWEGRLVCDGVCKEEDNRNRLERIRLSKIDERKCGWCREAYTVPSSKTKKDFCSPECSRRGNDEIRAFQRRALGQVSLPKPLGLQVLERDGWLCQACGEDTPQYLRGTIHPQAPEVDHIYPVSRGGTHEMHNLQCLCKRCNISKFNMTMEEWTLSGKRAANDNRRLDLDSLFDQAA